MTSAGFWTPDCVSSQCTNAVPQAVELHPWWHHASVLEGGVLDVSVPHVVSTSPSLLMKPPHAEFLCFKGFLVSSGCCCPSCSRTLAPEASPSPGRSKRHWLRTLFITGHTCSYSALCSFTWPFILSCASPGESTLSKNPIFFFVLSCLWRERQDKDMLWRLYAEGCINT